MNIRERMMAVYRNEVPDQIPVSVYSRYLPRGSTERLVRVMGLGILDYCPLTTMIAPPWHLLPGFVSEVKGAEFRICFSWERGRRLELRTYETPLGTVTQRTSQDPSYGSDWTEKFYISSLEDYRVIQYIVENSVIRSNEDAFLAKRDDMGEDGIILGRVDRCPFQKLLIELAGPERLLIDLYTNPDPVLSLLEALEKKTDAAFEMIYKSAAEVIWEPDNVSCDMTSPRYFEKYCLPHYIAHGKQLHERGKLYLVHMDGRLRAIRDLIARSPIDGIESFSFPEVGGDLSFTEASSAWPGKIILPNFPSPLAAQDEMAINSFLDKILDEVGPGRPFMLQVSEDIPPGAWRRVLPILCARLRR